MWPNDEKDRVVEKEPTVEVGSREVVSPDCTQTIWGFCVLVTSHLTHTIITLNHHSCAFFLFFCLSVFHWISWITPSLFCTPWVSVLSQDRLTGRERREREYKQIAEKWIPLLLEAGPRSLLRWMFFKSLILILWRRNCQSFWISEDYLTPWSFGLYFCFSDPSRIINSPQEASEEIEGLKLCIGAGICSCAELLRKNAVT